MKNNKNNITNLSWDYCVRYTAIQLKDLIELIEENKKNKMKEFGKLLNITEWFRIILFFQ